VEFGIISLLESKAHNPILEHYPCYQRLYLEWRWRQDRSMNWWWSTCNPLHQILSVSHLIYCRTDLENCSVIDLNMS